MSALSALSSMPAALSAAVTAASSHAGQPLIRRLQPHDADVYRALRLRRLRDYPDTFTSDYEEESARSACHAEQRLAALSGENIWGAFAGSNLPA
jgi:hypothetical protein